MRKGALAVHRSRRQTFFASLGARLFVKHALPAPEDTVFGDRTPSGVGRAPVSRHRWSVFMHLHVERWTARPSWLALSTEARIDYLDRMGPALRTFFRTGPTLLGVSLEEEKGPQATCQYVAVWRMPDGSVQGHQLNEILHSFGWNDYFRPTRGEVAPRMRKTFYDYGEELSESLPVTAPRRN